MDWLNTQFYRDFGYGLVYPQLLPHHQRRSDEVHRSAIEWGQHGARRWLANVRKLKSWNQVNQVFDEIVARNKGKAFVQL